MSTSASKELLIRLKSGVKKKKKGKIDITHLSPRACSSNESTMVRILSKSFIRAYAS